MTCACGIRSFAGVRRCVVPREEVLAPVVVEVAPDRVDVVRAVLRVVVLDEEARAADGVVVAVTRLLGTRPRERDLVQPGGDDALPLGPAPRPAGPGRRSGGSAVREPCAPVAARSRYRIPTGIERASARAAFSVRMSAGARSSTIAAFRSSGVSPANRVLASVSSPARARKPACGPVWNDGRVGPEERRRGADNLPVGQRDVDRDVVSADPPRPRRMGVGLAEDREPVQLGIPPRPAAATTSALERTEDRFERDDRGDLTRGPLAQRCAGRVPFAAARWSGCMSRSASPSRVPGVYAQTNRSFVSNGKTAARTLRRVEPVEPGSSRGRDLLGGSRHRASPAGLHPGGRGSGASRLRRAPAPAPSCPGRARSPRRPRATRRRP